MSNYVHTLKTWTLLIKNPGFQSLGVCYLMKSVTFHQQDACWSLPKGFLREQTIGNAALFSRLQNNNSNHGYTLASYTIISVNHHRCSKSTLSIAPPLGTLSKMASLPLFMYKRQNVALVPV